MLSDKWATARWCRWTRIDGQAGTHGLAGIFWLAVLAVASAVAGEEPEGVRFDRQIRPLLADRCLACHGPDAAQRQADLRLDVEASAKEAAIVPGDLPASELWRRINSDDPQLQMPPPDSGKQLSAAEIELFRRWIEAGAPWQNHWAFQPPVRPQPPPSADPWVQNPIDQFVLQQLTRAGLQPSPPAPSEVLLRRVYLDVIGLPPTVAEIDAWLADERPGAYERLLERLFDSPHYGERMAVDWLDGARFADTNGYQNDFARSMWLWRDWVIQAFNANQPFDQFTVEQLAGDLLPNPSQAQLIATGFNRNHRTVTEGGSIEEEWHVENIVDRVETTSLVFLGLTMGCARCHDHKYDPISQREFYQFYAFFNNIDEKGVYNETRGNVPPLLEVPTPEYQRRLAELDRQIADSQTLESQQQTELNAKRLAELQQQREQLVREVPTVMVMKERSERRPTYLLRRGQYDQPDQAHELQPDVPSCLPPLPADAPRNRLTLARWLVDERHPLLARVVVNRLWQRFFGQGLVRSSDNFGLQGESPSHPELLDWLATELIRSGWDLQALQRLILTSATYRQTSDVTPDLQALDPENRQLARGPRFRLSAEFVRDNSLAISGLLQRRIGGPSVKPYQPAGLWDELAGGANEGPYVQSQGADLHRRSLYTYRKRTVSHPTMNTFDAPSFEICWIQRSRTNTPLQSLALLNDTTYVEAARMLGQRMMTEASGSVDERLAYGFRLTTARWPSVAERSLLSAAWHGYQQAFARDPAAAAALIAHGDAPRNADLVEVELASYMTVGSLLLNLDETVTKN